MTNNRIFAQSSALKAALLAGAMLLSWALLHASAFAGPLDTLPPGRWYAFPNSLLSTLPSVYKDVNGNYLPTGNISIMDSWGGGTYDSDRDQLIVWGGGHTNYSGNEVYAFGPLTATTPTWKRLTNPSNPPAENTNYAPDGRPTTRHTQDSIAYLSGWGSRPSHNKMMNCVATGFWPNGYTGTQGDLFDFTIDGFTGEPWSRTALPPRTVFPGATCVFNPVTNRVWYHTVGGYYDSNGVYQAPGLNEYNPDNDTWTPRARYDVYSNESGTVDTKRNLLAVIQPAGVSAGQTGGVRIHNLNTPGAQPFFAITSGSPNPEQAYGPGFVYDPVNDRFLSWRGGSTIYALSIPSDIVNGTWVWTLVPLDAGNTVAPNSVSQANGTYKRFSYVPSLNGVVVVNANDQSVYFFKLAGAGSGASPTPVVTFTTSPTSITSGAFATLTWSSTNATSCAASGAWSGRRSTANTYTLSPIATSTYTLTCTGAGGNASQSAAITVLQ